MKKNKMMRLASWLLVLTLLTTCIISGTFAKYVTSDDANDTARVARWGVTTTISGALFGEHYFSKDEASPNQISAGITGSVDNLEVDEIRNIVAPGTKSENMTISIFGTPEVAGKIEVEVVGDENAATSNYSDIWLAGNEYGVMVNVKDTVKTDDDIVGLYTKTGDSYTLLTGEDKFVAGTSYYKLMDVVNVDDYATDEDEPRYDGEKYYPIVWTLSNAKSAGDYVDDDSAIHRVADLKDKINEIITGRSNTNSFNFDSRTQLDAQVGDTLIKWEWPFESEITSEITDEEGKVMVDEAGDPITTTEMSPTVNGCDTILGNLMTWDNGSKYQVVKIDSTDDTYTGVIKEETNGVTYAKAGDEKVACLTVGFNIKVTVSQVD